MNNSYSINDNRVKEQHQEILKQFNNAAKIEKERQILIEHFQNTIADEAKTAEIIQKFNNNGPDAFMELCTKYPASAVYAALMFAAILCDSPIEALENPEKHKVRQEFIAASNVEIFNSISYAAKHHTTEESAYEARELEKVFTDILKTMRF